MRRLDDGRRIREAVGVFFDVGHLQAAIMDLEKSGFDRKEIGLLAGSHTVRQRLGDFYRETNEFANGPDAPCTAFVEKLTRSDLVQGGFGDLFFYGATTAAGAAVASAAILGGAVLAAVTGALAVGAVGVLMGLVIHENDAEYVEDRLGEGHLLLFVRTPDEAHEVKAREILGRHGAHDPRILTVAAPDVTAPQEP